MAAGSDPTRLVPLVAVLLVLACGKAPARPEVPDPRDHTIAEQRRTISDLKGALTTARDQIRTLGARLDVAEQRLGLRPFQPRTLKRIRGEQRFSPGKCTLLTEPGARGRKGNLARYTKRFRRYVVAYWATWCKPCTTPEELAALGRLEADLKRVGSALVGVAIDGIEKVRGHPRAAEWHYPVWHRDDGHIEFLPKSFIDDAGLGLPLFLVVTGDGRLLYWRNKPLDPDVHEELLTAAVAPR